MSQSNAIGFDNPETFWDSKLAGDEYHFGRLPNEFLTLAASHFPSSCDVLCVADGEGRNSAWLAQQGHRVTAFDISSVGISKAKRLASELGVVVDYQQCRLEDWAWTPSRFDVVVAIFIQFTPPDTRRWLWEQIHQTLRTNGLLVIQGYSPAQLEYKTGGPSNLAHLYTKNLLHSELTSFKLLECFEYESVLNEGPGHSGQSALVRAIAQK